MLRSCRLVLAVMAQCLAVWLLASPALAANRVALIVGNSRYLNTPTLDNPANDAGDVAEALKGLGFNVTLRLDATKRQLDASLAQFARDARTADAALFYYAGHGMQFQGRNYLMPVDAELQDEVSLRYEMSSIDDVKAALQESSGVKILVLDSCRNNPLATRFTRSISQSTRDIPKVQGFARPDRVNGMVIVFATQADEVAADGVGRNSPFSDAFLRELKTPGLEVGTLFRRVEDDVFAATDGRQSPEMSISMVPEYYLNTADTDQMVWARIRENSDAGALKEFIARFPSSFYTPDARARLDLIERQQQAATEVGKADASAQSAAAAADRLKAQQADLEKAAADARAHEQKAAADAQNAATEAGRLKTQQAALEKALADAKAREERADAGAQGAAAEAERLKQQQADLQKAAAEARAREQGADANAQTAAAEADRLKRQQAELEKAVADAHAREQELAAKLAAAEAEKAKLAAQTVKADDKQPDGAAAPSAKPTVVADLSATEPASRAIDPLPQIRVELKRLGCYDGADLDWNAAPMKSAVAKYVRYANLADAAAAPDQTLLDDMKKRRSGLCPPECGAREMLSGGKCVAKTCGHGEVLAASGACVRTASAARAAAPKAAAPAPAKGKGGGHCFSFNGNEYCE